MSSDTQFTALGPTVIGFQCHGANIRLGGHMFGTENGVQARCGTAFGNRGAAVHAQSDTRDGNGVIATAHIGPSAFGIWASSNEGFAGRFDGRVHIQGNLSVAGTKAAAVRAGDGSLRCLYAVESPENWFEDFGFGRLEGGHARIDLDETFVSVIADAPYHVFLTQYDGHDGLYVTERDAGGFTVRSAGEARDAEFSWRVTAKRRDTSDARFERVEEPEEAEGKTLPEVPAEPPPAAG